MRMIGTITNQRQAADFGDHLLTLGIANQIEESGGRWLVWVERDDDLDRAAIELGQFLQNPDDPRYGAAGRPAARLRAEETRRSDRLRRNYQDVRTRWAAASQWNIPLTLTLIGVSVVISLATNLGSGGTPLADTILSWLPIAPYERVEQAGANYIRWYGLRNIESGEVWRLVTPVFIHYGVIHLVFNMLWLRDLGGAIEKTRGIWVLMGLVLAGAILPNLFQYYAPGFPFFRSAAWGQTSPAFGGMSGVVYALFGYVWIKARTQPHLGMHMPPPVVKIMLGWLLFTMIVDIIPVANAAHFGGLAVGVIWAGAPAAYSKLRGR